MNEVTSFIEQVEKGGFPALIGLPITREEADKVKAILEKRKQHIDDYYRCVVETRVLRKIR